MKIDFQGMSGDALLLEPREIYDPCVIGTCAVSGRAIYDVSKIISAFSEANGCSLEESEEYVDFNILQDYMGTHTPIYLFPSE